MEKRQKNYSKSDQFLWTDFPDAKTLLDERAPRCATESSTLAHFIDYGYSVIPSAVERADVDAFLADLDRALDREKNLAITYWDVDTDGVSKKFHEQARRQNLSKPEAKVLDVHVHVPSSQKLIFSPQIIGFLRDIFGTEPVAFQTLYFENGSQQGAHQDTAFVYTDPPYKFAASWIALEDISEGSGELFYYPKSQKLDDLIFSSGTKALLPGDPSGPRYSELLEKIASEGGLERERFHPKKGDVLFWASDLIHGGEIRHRDLTRRSLVTHYCPQTAAVPYARQSGKVPTHADAGGLVIAQY